jgi:hypothetical protein
MSDSTSSTGTGAQGAENTPQITGPEAYVIPAALAQATLNYLAAQPYREVFTLVQGFESLEPLPSQDGPDSTLNGSA